jgi:hypothetical protein
MGTRRARDRHRDFVKARLTDDLDHVRLPMFPRRLFDVKPQPVMNAVHHPG